MTTFRIQPHGYIDGRAAVEVIGADGELLATFYATDDHHFRLVSKRLGRVNIDRNIPPVVDIYLSEKP